MIFYILSAVDCLQKPILSDAFLTRKLKRELVVTSRLYKKVINFLDSKIDVDIDSKDFSRLLESHGFKIIDMTEINGLTYFRTQNLRRAAV